MRLGVIAGNFDIIHPGYMKMFKECKANCDKFLVFLHTDPTIERPEKIKPILSVEERTEILQGIRYIDEVVLHLNRNQANNEAIKDIVDAANEELKVPKKIVKRMAKTQ